MSNKIQVFDLSDASVISLTLTRFNKKNDMAKYVCKITDASMVFIGYNAMYKRDKKKLTNTLVIVLTSENREFLKENKNGNITEFSYTTLTATQIKIKDKNSVFDCNFL